MLDEQIGQHIDLPTWSTSEPSLLFGRSLIRRCMATTRCCAWRNNCPGFVDTACHRSALSERQAHTRGIGHA